MEKGNTKVFLHPFLERIWHIVHAVCILLLIISGAQIHWPEKLKIFESLKQAIVFHNTVGWITLTNFIFWFWYNLISRRISHYLLYPEDIWPGLFTQGKYYSILIFKGEPHPYSHTPENKFNPLQKLSYFILMFIFVPMLLASGVLFMYPSSFYGLIQVMGGLKTVAGIHTFLAFIFTAFIVVHLYLATTGSTVLDQFKSMVTGYAAQEEH